MWFSLASFADASADWILSVRMATSWAYDAALDAVEPPSDTDERRERPPPSCLAAARLQARRLGQLRGPVWRLRLSRP